MPAPPAPPLPASLSHFVLFSPTLRSPLPAPGPGPGPGDTEATDPEERNHDLEADLREAAQILFYTSRQAGGVSRDKMLRQVGLAKGLMGFADMLAPGELDQPKFWSIHSHRTRMVVYSPEPEFFIYLNITLAHAPPVAGATRGEPSSTAQGLSDRMLVDALARGYADFRFLHGPLAQLMPPSPSLSSLLEKYWTRFAFSLEATYLLSPPSPGLLQTWLGGYAPPHPDLSGAASRALETFIEDCDLEEHIVGIINAQGPLAVRGPGHSAMDEAGMRHLHHLLEASLPPPLPVEPQGKSDGRSGLGFGIRRKKERDESRKTSWASFGIGNAVSWVPGIGSRPATPMPADESKASKAQPSASVGGKVTERASSASNSTNTTATRWPSLGLTGLSEAMGNMGSAMGLGTKSTDGSRADTPTRVEDGTAAHKGITEEQREPADATIEDPSPSEPPGGADVSSTPDTHGSSKAHVSPPTKREREPSPEPSGDAEEDSSASHGHDVLQTSVVLPDLEAAVQTEPEVAISWESRLVHVVDGETTTKRNLQWVIRDNILLFILHTAEPADPSPQSEVEAEVKVSARSTLSLFSKLSALLVPEQQPNSDVSTQLASSPHSPLSNSVIFHPSGSSTRISGPPIDTATGATMMELKDTIESYPNTSEIFARTAAGRFVLAKRTRTLSVPAQEPNQSETHEPPHEQRGEVYMLVGRKDASLTDAEHAMRGLARAHPELVA